MRGHRLKTMRSQQRSVHPFPSPLKSLLLGDALDSWHEDGDNCAKFSSRDHHWKTQTLAHPVKGSAGAAHSPVPTEQLRHPWWVQRCWFQEKLFFHQGMLFLKIRLAERSLKSKCTNAVFYFFLLFYFPLVSISLFGACCSISPLLSLCYLYSF